MWIIVALDNTSATSQNWPQKIRKPVQPRFSCLYIYTLFSVSIGRRKLASRIPSILSAWMHSKLHSPAVNHPGGAVISRGRFYHRKCRTGGIIVTSQTDHPLHSRDRPFPKPWTKSRSLLVSPSFASCLVLLRTSSASGPSFVTRRNQIQCEFVHFFLRFGIGLVWNAPCHEPYIKEELIDTEVLPSPASCFLRYWGCRFKLSFGNFGADLVVVQLLVKESGHPQRVDEYTVWQLLRVRCGFRVLFVVMLSAWQKTFLASPSFFPCNMSLGISIKKDRTTNWFQAESPRV